MIAHVLTMAFNGLLLFTALRCAVPLLIVVLKSVLRALEWFTDPLIEWVIYVLDLVIPGTTVTLDDLHDRLKPRCKSIQLWGWGRRQWMIGIARGIK